MRLIMYQTLVEIFCDEAGDCSDFHLVFSRFGLPWILAPMEGVRIEQVTVTGEQHIYNIVNVPNYAVAHVLTEHLMLAGWNLMHGLINGRDARDALVILEKIEDASSLGASVS